MEVDYCAKEDSGLFGEKSIGFGALNFLTSPPVRPSTMSLNLGKRDLEAEGWSKFDQMLEWGRSPENIGLEELDGILSDF